MAKSVVIVGAGQAGSEAAVALRQGGFDGAITIVGEESHPPYRRPPLSKDLLAGESRPEALYIRSADAYAKAAVELRLGTRVLAIEPNRQTLTLDRGGALSYDHLIIATGGRPRKLAMDGADGASNLHYLRTIEDALGLQEQLLPGRHVTILGGGYIGLEVTAVAIGNGLRVTVVEAAPRLLSRVTAAELSAFYESYHESKGVDIRTDRVPIRLGTSAGRITEVHLSDGAVLQTDLVIVGVGLQVNIELARSAGLKTANGIVVDVFGRTSIPNIHAAGDCTEFDSTFLGRSVRIESVQNATEQARSIASMICGIPKPYDPVPWFWSNQYKLRLQMVGMPQGQDTVCSRGSVGSDSFAFFYLRNGFLIGAETVNRPQEFMLAKQLVAERAQVDARALADEAIPLKQLLDQSRTVVSQ